jgi:hypothetical protein
MDFLKEQLLFFFGSTFVIIAGLVAFIIFPSFRKYRIIGWSFLFTILWFVWFRAKGYYAIGLYPVLLAFGSVYFEQILNGKRTKYLRPVALIIPLLLFLPMLQLAFPNRSPLEIRQHAQQYKDFGLLRWEDGKDHDLPQDFADMIGWKELAHKVDSAYAGLNEKDQTLVLCDNYGQAGAINYYSKYRQIQAVSFNADYLYWVPVNKEIKNVILVKDIFDRDKTREKEKPLFETVMKFDQVNTDFAREKGTSISVLRNAKSNINEIIQKEIEKKKNNP